VHAATIGTFGIATCDSKSVKNGCRIQVDAGWMIEDMVAVVATIVQYANIAAEDGFIESYVTRIGIRLSKAGVATFKSYAVDELKCSGSVAGCDTGSQVGLVNSLGNADFVTVLSRT
jgi:hypothetical protein